MRRKSFKRNKLGVVFTLVFALLMTIGLSLGGTPVYAKSDDEASLSALGDALSKDLGGKKYPTESGAYISGDSLLQDDYGNVNEDAFNSLTSKGKRAFLDDAVKASESKINKDKESGRQGASTVTDDTQSTWLQNLQQCDGIGSKLMNNILAQTKPDFVKANKIWKPFASPLGTATALLCIVIGALITFSMAWDLAWMAIPFFRGLGGDGDGSNSRPWGISFEAYSAVQEAESASDGKTAKIAVLIYFKKRSIMLFVLGCCLLFFVQGEIFTFVSWFLDLLSGFLGL
jgi:hypothetical protein